MIWNILNHSVTQIFSYSIFIILGFILWSFIFWRNLRDNGLEDDKIFDNLLLVSVSAIVVARLFFVGFNWHIFAPNLLRIMVFWKFPGFSFWGAIFGGLAGVIIFTLKQKLPMPLVFDSYGLSFPYVMLWVSLASYLNKTVIGTVTNLFWGIQIPGLSGKRHPVALYSAFIGLFIILFIFGIRKKWQHKFTPGIISALVFFIFGFGEFMLAFFRDDLLYLDSVSIEHILAFIVLTVSAVILIISLIKIKNTPGDSKINNL